MSIKPFPYTAQDWCIGRVILHRKLRSIREQKVLGYKECSPSIAACKCMTFGKTNKQDGSLSIYILLCIHTLFDSVPDFLPTHHFWLIGFLDLKQSKG